MKPLAVLSDVHGNLTALEAVLSHIKANGIATVVCLGDLVGKGPRSQQAVDRCRQTCSVLVRGNWDELVSVAPSKNEVMAWYGAQLDDETKRYLLGLPNSWDLGIGDRRVRMFHASSTGLYERVNESDPPDAHRNMFEGTEFTGNRGVADLVLYGDIHRVFERTVGTRSLVNVGSVGNPLDSPQSSYVVVEGATEGPKVTVVRVAYDVEKELAEGRRLGMAYFDQYATELRTGRYCRRVRSETEGPEAHRLPGPPR